MTSVVTWKKTHKPWTQIKTDGDNAPVSMERVQQFVGTHTNSEAADFSSTPVQQAMFLGIEGISTSNIHKLRKELRNEHRDSGDYLVVVVPPHSIMTVVRLLLDSQENSHAARTNEHIELFTKAVEGRLRWTVADTSLPSQTADSGATHSSCHMDPTATVEGANVTGEHPPATVASTTRRSPQPLLLILKASPAARANDMSLQQLWKDVVKPILTTRRTRPLIPNVATAPHDLYVPVGHSGCIPLHTHLFQIANIPTKIQRGMIEVLQGCGGSCLEKKKKGKRSLETPSEWETAFFSSSEDDGDDEGTRATQQHFIAAKGQTLSGAECQLIQKALDLDMWDTPKMVGAFDFSQQLDDGLLCWYPSRAITTNWERHIKDASTQLVCLAAAVGALPSQHDDDEEPSSFSTFARHVQNKFAAEHSRLLAKEEARMREQNYDTDPDDPDNFTDLF